MNDEDALRETICTRPNDDAPRLVYADWLEETGEPSNVARAEFIRVQIALDNRLPAEDGYDELRRRQLELMHYHGRAWVHPLGKVMTGVEYHRGFVRKAVIELGRLLTHADWFEREPIEELRLVLYSPDLESLARAAEGAGDEQLAEDLHHYYDMNWEFINDNRGRMGGRPDVGLERLLFLFELAGDALARAATLQSVKRLRALLFGHERPSLFQFNR